ncbi:BaiN/RdsA family NAD(P)/FAD-dependent oxidoreductase [Desulfocicer niacini]
MTDKDVIIIGAGASGLMCAIAAGRRQRRVVVLDHGKQPGRKILMSGGGRCNFTNTGVEADNFISHNPHFVKSALSRFSQWDFLEMINAHHIPYHERNHGQLFCDNSSGDIMEMLLKECKKAKVDIQLEITIDKIRQMESGGFAISTNQGVFQGKSLVVATGGLSIPGAGATPLGYRIAEQFNIKVWPTRAGLVPFTLQPPDKAKLSNLPGISVDATVTVGQHHFRESILFTHRGLSGPAILQISSLWHPGEELTINLLPDIDLEKTLIEAQSTSPKRKVKSLLADFLPKRLVTVMVNESLADQALHGLSHNKFRTIAHSLHQWQLKPGGTEGYRTAEVTLGGVDCDAISSKTMETRQVKGLFFTGEVLDVTGWLGGYNLQWAWSSGWCAGQYV